MARYKVHVASDDGWETYTVSAADRHTAQRDVEEWLGLEEIGAPAGSSVVSVEEAATT